MRTQQQPSSSGSSSQGSTPISAESDGENNSVDGTPTSNVQTAIARDGQGSSNGNNSGGSGSGGGDSGGSAAATAAAPAEAAAAAAAAAVNVPPRMQAVHPRQITRRKRLKPTRVAHLATLRRAIACGLVGNY